MKKITITAILLVAFTFMGFSQTQLGSKIDGTISYEEFGTSVAVSDDGTIMAIGTNAQYSTDTAGTVEVYQYNGSAWVQIGIDIIGDADDDYFGWSVAISSDGSIVAVGAKQKAAPGYVRVFQNNSGTWTQIGSDILGDVDGDNFGYSVALSANGTKLAVGAPFYDTVTDDTTDPVTTATSSGQVKTFEFNGSSWDQSADAIVGAVKFDNMGYSVSLSNDGSVLAFGAKGTDVNASGTGSVEVRELNILTGTWDIIGSAFNGAVSFDSVGLAVSLSGDGSIVALSAYKDDTAAADAGAVMIYKNVSGTWTQLGSSIYGDAASDFSGYSLSLSDDGALVAVGAYGNDGANGASSLIGQTKVYGFTNDAWRLKGDAIYGAIASANSGKAVAISGDGDTVVIGSARTKNDNLEDTWHGSVYAFDMSEAILSSNSFVLENFAMYPNPASDTVTINLTNGLELERVNIYSTLGQLVKVEKQTSIYVNALSKGSYFFEVITNKGKATKMIIVK